ncbi:MAG TPA: helix-turn-helix transcriptional regulator [Candidatus Saccharimonadales bacterium]|nr:helix-turn-helix transcriptional regulator [Candidatus Saccharimonadales bacterium]
MSNSMPIQEKVGLNIQHIRQEASLTQEVVARRARINTNTLAKIERGVQTPSLQKLEAIAKALDVEEKTFFDFKRLPTSP